MSKIYHQYGLKFIRDINISVFLFIIYEIYLYVCHFGLDNKCECNMHVFHFWTISPSTHTEFEYYEHILCRVYNNHYMNIPHKIYMIIEGNCTFSISWPQNCISWILKLVCNCLVSCINSQVVLCVLKFIWGNNY